MELEFARGGVEAVVVEHLVADAVGGGELLGLVEGADLRGMEAIVEEDFGEVHEGAGGEEVGPEGVVFRVGVGGVVAESFGEEGGTHENGGVGEGVAEEGGGFDEVRGWWGGGRLGRCRESR